MKTHRPVRCSCGCIVIVWRRKGYKATLLRALALADHKKNGCQRRAK